MCTASINPTIDLPVTTHTNSPNITTTETKMNTSVITNSHRQIRRDCLVVSCGVNGVFITRKHAVAVVAENLS